MLPKASKNGCLIAIPVVPSMTGTERRARIPAADAVAANVAEVYSGVASDIETEVVVIAYAVAIS